MDALAFVIGVAILAFAAGVFGLKLHAWLPEKHAPDNARDMIGAMTGLLGLLLALVLGTLVGSSYTLYATQKSELETLEARMLQLDAALQALGRRLSPAVRACARRSSKALTRSGAERPRTSRE